MGQIGEGEREGFETVRLEAGELVASVVPGAGLVCASLEHGGEELLGQRAGLGTYVERAKTMGIPLLHPWANRLGAFEYAAGGQTVRLDPERQPLGLDARGLPNHGVPGASLPWEVASAGVEGEAATLRGLLAYDREDLLAVFPFPHELAVTYALTPGELRVDTELRPSGPEPVPVSFGWHPYLTLPGLAREAWEVEVPVRRRLVLDERQIPTGAHEPVEPYAGPLEDRAYDDGYDAFTADPVTFALSGGGRRIELAFGESYTHAQVFAPPGDALIAYEPMTAPADALRTGTGLRWVQPGSAFRAVFSVRVS